MEKLDYLIEVSASLQRNDVLAELNFIKDQLNSGTSELVLPIVGEFSSGKTTFINELLEVKKLETSSKATTSVIYEIYFGNDKEDVEIIFENNETRTIENITSIKNEDLKNVKLIKIYDKSKKIDSKTILVDTPGLSSNNPKHLEVLSTYLPEADAIFLFSDINQQITNSLLEFIKINKLLHLPLYIVITKTDTKTKEELESIKHYITNLIDIKVDSIIGISSKNNDLDEFFQLMSKIQADKNNIIKNALKYRIEKIVNYLKTYIENLIKSTNSESNFDEEIKKEKRKNTRILSSIDNLIYDVRNEIDDAEDTAIKNFEKNVSSRLDNLINTRNESIDAEATDIINSSANLVFANYQLEIQKKLYMIASRTKNSDLLELRSIEGVDLNALNMGELSYGMNLSQAGQNTVKGLTTGIKIAAAIGAVVITVATVGTAAPAVATAVGGASTVSGTATIAGAAGTAISAVDAVSDIASINASRKLRKKLIGHAQNTSKYVEQIQGHIKTYEDYNVKAGQMIKPDENHGFMEGFIGSATDSVIAKPERERMVKKFLRESLKPEFKNKLALISEQLLNDMQNSLKQEATVTINQIEETLRGLEEMKNNEKQNFVIYIESLNEFLLKLS